MKQTTAEDVAQLARDLDKMPSGEVIIEKLLTGMIVLKRENAELKAGHAELRAENAELNAKLDKALDQMLALTKLVGDHAAILQLQGQRHQDGGGIVH